MAVLIYTIHPYLLLVAGFVLGVAVTAAALGRFRRS